MLALVLRVFGPRAKNIYWMLWKKIVIFMISNGYVGHFRGVSLLTSFDLSLCFWVTGQIKWKKSEFLWFSGHQNSRKLFFLQLLFFVNFYQSKKGLMSYKIVFKKKSGYAQKSVFLQKNVFLAVTRIYIYFLIRFYSLLSPP